MVAQANKVAGLRQWRNSYNAAEPARIYGEEIGRRETSCQESEGEILGLFGFRQSSRIEPEHYSQRFPEFDSSGLRRSAAEFGYADTTDGSGRRKE